MPSGSQLVVQLRRGLTPHRRVLVDMQLGVVEQLMLRVEVEMRLDGLLVLWLILAVRQLDAQPPLGTRVREAVLCAQHAPRERPIRLAFAPGRKPALVEAINLLAELARPASKLVADFWLATAQPQLAQLVLELLWLAVVGCPAVCDETTTKASCGFSHGTQHAAARAPWSM